MQDIVEVTGMIIQNIPVKDYDRRITILTRENGKIGVFVRGARRQNNRFLGIRQFCYGHFELYQGRDSYTLKNAQILNYFEEIVTDIENTCYGMYFFELANYYAREALIDPEMDKLLYVALVALTKPAIPKELVRRVFELRIMAIHGEYDPKPVGNVSDGCRYAWNFILTTPIEKLYRFTLKSEVFEELAGAVDQSMHRFVDRKMNSLEILRGIRP